MHHVHIHRHAASVDDEVSLPLLLNVGRHREARQPPVNLHFRHNIAFAVGPEQLPLLRVMLGQISSTAPVTLCGGAGDAEVSDERLAHRQFLLLLRKPQSLSCGIQTGGAAAVQSMEHRVTPLIYRQRNTEIFRQAVPLECSVVCVFDEGRVANGAFHPVRQHLSAGEVHNFYRPAIYTVRTQQDFKIWALDIFVQPGLANVHAAVCFEVDA